MTHPVWPLFDLRVHTPKLELRYIDDDLATELAQLASARHPRPGVHAVHAAVDRRAVAATRTFFDAVVLEGPGGDLACTLAPHARGDRRWQRHRYNEPRRERVLDVTRVRERVVAGPRLSGPRSRQGDPRGNPAPRVRRARRRIRDHQRLDRQRSFARGHAQPRLRGERRPPARYGADSQPTPSSSE